ncbi:dual specificity protein phosphatase family protein [Halovenus rubra]|uniref:Dual specificity protein phosphatase family protein n=2 Tax=Halovenus rubra TaxID=869890 RepID=A0ABD5XAY0_9EURY|nr:dual specificity protein phosphatase family protein [Halovenus rubra]
MGNFGMVIHDAHRFSPAAPATQYVYGSCLPGWHTVADNALAVDQWISSVQSQGIERVCCLLAGSSDEIRSTALGSYYETFGEENVCHVPVSDRHLVGREPLIETILPFLKTSVAMKSPVVVQCLSGIGRTGQVLTAWLVATRGYSPEDAIETVQERGRDPLATVEQGNATEEELFELLESMQDVHL